MPAPTPGGTAALAGAPLARVTRPPRQVRGTAPGDNDIGPRARGTDDRPPDAPDAGRPGAVGDGPRGSGPAGVPPRRIGARSSRSVPVDTAPARGRPAPPGGVAGRGEGAGHGHERSRHRSPAPVGRAQGGGQHGGRHHHRGHGENGGHGREPPSQPSGQPAESGGARWRRGEPPGIRAGVGREQPTRSSRHSRRARPRRRRAVAHQVPRTTSRGGGHAPLSSPLRGG